MKQIRTNSKMLDSKDLSTSLRRSHFKELLQKWATKSIDHRWLSTASDSPPLSRSPAIALLMAKRKRVRLPPRPTSPAPPTQKRPRLKALSQWSSAWSTRCARTGERKGSVNMEISASSHTVWMSWLSEALPMDPSLPSPWIPLSPLLLHPQRTQTPRQNRLPKKKSKRRSKKRQRWRK